MSNLVIRKRRGTTIQFSSLVARPGEVYIDLTKPTLIVHDGTTAGGIPLAKEVHTHANATESTGGFLSPSDKAKLDSLSLEGGIQTLLSNTSPLPPETTINFSTDFTLTDNSGASRTECAISQSFRDGLMTDEVALIVALS